MLYFCFAEALANRHRIKNGYPNITAIDNGVYDQSIAINSSKVCAYIHTYIHSYYI